jgi:hypothetical protein
MIGFLIYEANFGIEIEGRNIYLMLNARIALMFDGSQIPTTLSIS